MSVFLWLASSEVLRFLLVLGCALGLVALPLAGWALLWKAAPLPDNGTWLRQVLHDNEQLDELLRDKGRS